MNNNVEQNPFKIWYLEYPIFQGWVSSNEYDILILNVAFAKCVKIALKDTKRTYTTYSNKLC